MDLKNKQITIRELLSNQRAHSVLSRHFAAVVNSPMANRFGNMTLQNAMHMGRRYLSTTQMEQILAELEQC